MCSLRPNVEGNSHFTFYLIFVFLFNVVVYKPWKASWLSVLLYCHKTHSIIDVIYLRANFYRSFLIVRILTQFNQITIDFGIQGKTTPILSLNIRQMIRFWCLFADLFVLTVTLVLNSVMLSNCRNIDNRTRHFQERLDIFIIAHLRIINTAESLPLANFKFRQWCKLENLNRTRFIETLVNFL